MQLLDILTAIGAVAVIDLAIWTTSAQSMRGSGDAIGGPEDLTAMMERAVGPIGPPLLWVTVLFVTFSSMPSTAFIYSRVVEDGFRSSRRKMQGDRVLTDSGRIMRWLPIAGLTLPLVFALPWAPNLIVLTVLGGAISVVAVPAFVFGILYLTSSRRLMLPEMVNKWWEVLILILIAVIAVWAVYGLIVNLIDPL